MKNARLVANNIIMKVPVTYGQVEKTENLLFVRTAKLKDRQNLLVDLFIRSN